MTTKPKAPRFRIPRTSTSADPARTATRPANQQPAAPVQTEPTAVPQTSPESPASTQQANTPPQEQGVVQNGVQNGTQASADVAPTALSPEAALDAIRQEGLTGRQLRMARRVAQKNNIAATSDFDAVRQLRDLGIDPFQRANVLDLVAPNGAQTNAAAGQMQVATAKVPAEQAKVQLPQTIQKNQTLPSTQVGTAPIQAEARADAIRSIQQDIARRRRRNIASLFARLALFVFLPTLAAAHYFHNMATPMYGTKSEFVIQQAESTGGGGLGSLFSGTGLATQTDSTTVQSFMTSREAFTRLDADHDFIAHFSDETIDAIQRLPADATREDAYDLFVDNVLIGYDPTEGILKMEVIAADPDKSQEFSEALIGYAEEQVDQLTQRVRNEQMRGASENYELAELRRTEALQELVSIQEEVQQTDPVARSAALQQRITSLEIRQDEERLSLASLLANRRPNEASVNAVEAEINRLDDQITLLRSELSNRGDGGSIVANNARLRQAEENYAFETGNVQAAIATMDSARIEANRQVRYLSVSVAPIAPDEPTYPRAFENTVLSILIFSGIYLMISLTASILREQVSS